MYHGGTDIFIFIFLLNLWQLVSRLVVAKQPATSNQNPKFEESAASFPSHHVVIEALLGCQTGSLILTRVVARSLARHRLHPGADARSGCNYMYRTISSEIVVGHAIK